MRKNENNESLGSIIKRIFQNPKIKKKYFESIVKSSLERMFKSYYTRHFEKVYLSNQVLHIKLNSSSMRHQLELDKTQLVSKLNLELNEAYIKNIKVF